MAQIFPFRGIRYNLKAVGDLSKVVTQPYDQITDDLREKYYARHPYNFTRIISGRKEPDTSSNTVYTRAADYLNEWLRDGILVRDEKPALYVYCQEYKIDNEIKTRKGLVALVELSTEFGTHEKTHKEPKIDRFNLMKTTESNTETIFLIYKEQERIINQLLNSAIEGREPNMLATDDFGCIHRMWAVTDVKVIKEVQARMGKINLNIADGHHRFETAFSYKEEMEAKGKKNVPGATESYNNFMMTLVNIDEPGLTVLPTHRLIYGIEKDRVDNLVSNAMKYFTVEHFPLGDNDQNAVKRVIETMKIRHASENLFALYLKGDHEIKLLSLKDKTCMDKLVKEKVSDDWKKLDIAILHTVLMDHFLGITQKMLEDKTNVEYLRDPYETFKKVKEDERYQLGFLVNATSVEQVMHISINKERMPQKSTDFFPKLLSGMVMCKLMIE